MRTIFNVVVAKDTHALKFELVYEDNQVSIMFLSYEPKEGYDDNSYNYTGKFTLEIMQVYLYLKLQPNRLITNSRLGSFK